MMMNPPTVPHGYVNAPSYDELVTALDLIRHATAPSHDDGAHHENAHDLADGILKRVEARRKQDALAESPALVAEVGEPKGWRSALKFYADRCHFMLSNGDAWDTVSGEPSNFWCDEEGTATVEDGTLAARALAGDPLPDDAEEEADAAASPVVIAGEKL